MFGRLIATLGASGLYFMFASFAWLNIQQPIGRSGEAFAPMWWGFLVAAVAAYLFTLRLIWKRNPYA